MTFITHILTYLIAIIVVTEHKTAAQNMTSSTASPPTQPIDLTSQFSPVRSYAWLIVLIVLASLGILTLLGIQIYVLIKLFVSPTSDSTHPLKPWRSHWLGQTLLFGVFCSYATMFAFLPYSCPATCAIIRFCVGVSYAICFSALLVKLLVVLGARYGQLSFFVQFVLFFFIVSVQIVIDVEWLILRRPVHMIPLNPPVVSATGVEPWGTCNPGFTEHVQSLVYIMFLIAACIVLAICAHRIDANHREGVFIGLAAGLTVPIWLTWTLIGFLVNNVLWDDPCVAYGLLATSTWILVIVFVPKLYYINSISNSIGARELQAYIDSYAPSVYPTLANGSVADGDLYRGRVNNGADFDIPLPKRRQDVVTTGFESTLRFTGDGGSDVKIAGGTNGAVMRERDVTRNSSTPYDHDITSSTPNLRYPGAPAVYVTRPSSVGSRLAPNENTTANSRGTSTLTAPRPSSTIEKVKDGGGSYYYYQADRLQPSTTILANRETGGTDGTDQQSYIASEYVLKDSFLM